MKEKVPGYIVMKDRMTRYMMMKGTPCNFGGGKTLGKRPRPKGSFDSGRMLRKGVRPRGGLP